MLSPIISYFKDRILRYHNLYQYPMDQHTHTRTTHSPPITPIRGTTTNNHQNHPHPQSVPNVISVLGNKSEKDRHCTWFLIDQASVFFNMLFHKENTPKYSQSPCSYQAHMCKDKTKMTPCCDKITTPEHSSRCTHSTKSIRYHTAN